MADFQINGRFFRNQTSYEAGLRDQKRIERIEEKASTLDLEGKRDLLEKMRNDVFRFESALGEDYIDQFEEDLLLEVEKLNQKNSRRGRHTKANSNTVQRSKKSNKNGGLNQPNGKIIQFDSKWSKHKNPTDLLRQKNTADKQKQKDLKKHPDSNRKKSKKQTKKLEEYDKDMQKIILQEMKKNDLKRKFMMVATGFVAVGCLSLFILRMIMEQKNEDIYEDLATQKENSEQVSGGVNRKVEVHLTEEGEVELVVLPEYEKLYGQNENLIGWLSIDDTNIDYPVMKASDRTYYLTHGFDEEYDRNGSIFMDPDCDVVHRSTNIILYGHHMHTGKMFGTLDKYKDYSYYQKHPVIEFDTIYEHGTYEVVYAFNSQVFYEDEITFKYYQFIDAVSEEAFYSNCEQMAEMSFYDTGIKPQYGDMFLTLSTCDKSESEQGRFVVVARKIN